MRASTGQKWTRLPDRFTGLCAWHPPRPIHGSTDLAKARRSIDRLALLPKRTADQEDFLETLIALVDQFEIGMDAMRTNHLDPIDTLQYLMEGRGMNASDLGRVLGQRTLGHAILSRRRSLSKSNILALCRHFSVGPQVFLKPTNQKG